MAVSSTFCVRVLPPVRSQPAAALFHSSIFVAWQPVNSHSPVTISLHHFDFRVLCCNCLVTNFSAWRMLTYLTSAHWETIAYPWLSILISFFSFFRLVFESWWPKQCSAEGRGQHGFIQQQDVFRFVCFPQ